MTHYFIALFSLILFSFEAMSAATTEPLIYEPEEKFTDFNINLRENFLTMEKVLNETTDGTVATVKEAGFGDVVRLKSTKNIGDNVFVVDQYNYRKGQGDVPTLIVVAGKPNLEDSFGKTQNGAVTIETRNGLPALKNEFQFLFLGYHGAFAKELAAMRNEIYNYMAKENLSFFGKKEAEAMVQSLANKNEYPKLTEYVSSFVANATPRVFDHDRASFVVTQIWKEENRPYGNENNLGIMYVVPPEESETIADAKTWLNLIYDTGRNIIVNSLNVLDEVNEQIDEDKKLDNIAVQVHLPGAGKFLFEGVTQTETNAVFVKGLVDAINEVKKMENGNEIAQKLELHFAFTPHYYTRMPLQRIKPKK